VATHTPSVPSPRGQLSNHLPRNNVMRRWSTRIGLGCWRNQWRLYSRHCVFHPIRRQFAALCQRSHFVGGSRLHKVAVDPNQDRSSTMPSGHCRSSAFACRTCGPRTTDSIAETGNPAPPVSQYLLGSCSSSTPPATRSPRIALHQLGPSAPF